MKKIFWCKKMKFYKLNSYWVTYKLHIELFGKAFRLPYWVGCKIKNKTEKTYKIPFLMPQNV